MSKTITPEMMDELPALLKKAVNEAKAVFSDADGANIGYDFESDDWCLRMRVTPRDRRKRAQWIIEHGESPSEAMKAFLSALKSWDAVLNKES